MKQLRRVVLPLITVALLFSSLSSIAQTPEPRIKSAITETSRVVLSNSRTPRVRDAEDLGTVSPETTVPGITLVFKRSAAQEATLKELLSAQQNTASPLYHHWLTPETFATRFGVADEDIATTKGWLASRGFHIEGVARSRDRITFSGTAAQIQGAFGTELHHYRTEGELHFAPSSDLTLPAELAPLTAAVLHLSDFRPKPSIKVRAHPHPDFTSASTQAHYLTPADIGMMYNSNPLISNYFTGTGQKLAVVGQSYVDTSATSSVSTFLRYFGVTNQINTVLVPGTGVEAISPGDVGESEIDLEYSSTIAFQANTFLVYVGANQNNDIFDALAFAITENIAPIISISYAVCEPLMSATDLDQNNALFEEAAAQGQTLVAASGDSGSTSCARFPSSDLNSTQQQQALAVNFPASSPYVTAVGGTQMAAGTFDAGLSSYWANAVSIDLTYSLLSYVPEVVWNEDSAQFGIAAGGGGTSTYFPRPSWQSGVPGILNGTYRLLPDLALQSSIASPGFLICSDDPGLDESQISTCDTGFQGSSKLYTRAGGTSFAAPIFAGLLALLNQVKQEAGQGNINPVLYSLAVNPTTYAAVFHDITSGTNACLPNAATCSAAGQSGYAATPGYDQATGLGSIDFNALTKAWPSTSNTMLLPTFVQLYASNTTLAPGEEYDIQFVVGDTYVLGPPSIPPTPTGNVSVSVDGVVVNPSLALPSTSMENVYNLTAPTTTGSHLITVTYPGDATHSASNATTVINIGSLLATGGISLTAGNLTIANGSTGSTNVTVTPTTGYNGRVIWSLVTTGGIDPLIACYTMPSLPVSSVSTVKLTIGVGAACTQTVNETQDLRPLTPSLASNDPHPSNQATSATAVCASLLICGLLAGRRRKIRMSLLLTLASLAYITTGLTGCGGASGSNNTTTPPSKPATTYNFTLTGKDSVNSSITASTTFTLTVN